MRKLISFMHLSLDGYVAGPKGEMDWIKVDEVIFDHVEKRIQLTDTALYGRKTFRMMEDYWPTAANQPEATQHDKNHSIWYSEVHKVVLSNSLKGVEMENTTIIGENLAARMLEIKNTQPTPGRSGEILLFGSPQATHSLRQLGLIDGYWLFVNPIVLGQGIPLFEGSNEKLNLRLMTAARSFDCGVTELNYMVS